MRGSLIVLSFLVILASCQPTHPAPPGPGESYLALLNKFPIHDQGLGFEPVLKPFGLSEQPMTYGLVLSAESIHYQASPNKESRERIHAAVRWLVDNKDLDGDGKPGWGLPQTYDAFSDGSVNPANHPYTITTAIVIEGLLNALGNKDLWDEEKRHEIQSLIAATIVNWCKQMYRGEGFFLYSSTDGQYYIPNASGYFLSSMVRALTEDPAMFTQHQRSFVESRTHSTARYLVQTVHREEGLPRWDAYTIPGTSFVAGPDDLMHHIYTLWGIEEYRSHFSQVKIPFTINESLRSVDRFWKRDRVYSFPNHKSPADLWGLGMMEAFYARYGEYQMAKKTLHYMNKANGPIPDLTIYPKKHSDDGRFYSRYAAHVLLGLSYMMTKEN